MQVFLCLSSIDHFLCKRDFSKILHMFIIRFSMFVQDKTFLSISLYRRRPFCAFPFLLTKERMVAGACEGSYFRFAGWKKKGEKCVF